MTEDNAKLAMNTIRWLNQRPPSGVPEFGADIATLVSSCMVLFFLMARRMKLAGK